MTSLYLLLQDEVCAMGPVGPIRGYLECMRLALEKEPPPFGNAWYGDSFRSHAINPYWLAQSLISNSIKEGKGARDLWVFANHIKDQNIVDLVRKHAMDEARHARLYVGLLQITFPNAMSMSDRMLILSEAPTFDKNVHIEMAYPTEKIFDILIQINFGEFRTRIHQLLMQPVLDELCTQKQRAKMLILMKSIADDELAHLRYTAELINTWVNNGNEEIAKSIFRKRLKQFNDLTLCEVGEQVFSG